MRTLDHFPLKRSGVLLESGSVMKGLDVGARWLKGWALISETGLSDLGGAEHMTFLCLQLFIRIMIKIK